MAPTVTLAIVPAFRCITRRSSCISARSSCRAAMVLLSVFAVACNDPVWDVNAVMSLCSWLTRSSTTVTSERTFSIWVRAFAPRSTARIIKPMPMTIPTGIRTRIIEKCSGRYASGRALKSTNEKLASSFSASSSLRANPMLIMNWFELKPSGASMGEGRGDTE